MTDEVRAWLPATVFGGSAVRAILEETVAEWAGRWFAAATIRLGDITPRSADPATGAGSAWRLPGKFTAVSASRAMVQNLLERALDVHLDGMILTDIDRNVTRVFAGAVIDDLAHSLDGLFDAGHLEKPAPDHRSADQSDLVEFHLADGRDDILKVALPAAPLLHYIKARLPSRVARAPITGSLVDAVSAARVEVEAYLGSAAMSLADLEHLALGDVVVLDTPIQCAEAVRLMSHERMIANGAFGEADGQVALTLTRLK